jgi:CRISPR-associated protein Cas2
MFYVVSYDIPDDRKRNKTARTLLDFGTRVQFSVFECIMDNDVLNDLKTRLGRIVSDEDSIRIYPLCAKCESTTQVLGTGKITKDEDVYIL